MPIPTYRLLSFDQLVGTGATAPRYVGISGVAKAHQPGRYTLVNEWVCAEIAKLLRLPIPPSFLTKSDNGSHHFVSTDFSLSREALPPVSPAEVIRYHPALGAQLVAFDTLVGNADRHPGNLALHPDTHQLMVYDHSHALFGWGSIGTGVAWLSAITDDVGILGQDPAGNGRGSRHCLLDHVTSPLDLREAAARVVQLNVKLISEIAHESRSLDLPETDARFLDQFLADRCVRTPTLLEAAFSKFAKLDQGTLL